LTKMNNPTISHKKTAGARIMKNIERRNLGVSKNKGLQVQSMVAAKRHIDEINQESPGTGDNKLGSPDKTDKAPTRQGGVKKLHRRQSEAKIKRYERKNSLMGSFSK